MNFLNIVSKRSAPSRGGYGGYMRVSLYEVTISGNGKAIWKYAKEDTEQTTSDKKLDRWCRELAKKHLCLVNSEYGSLHNVPVAITNLEMAAQLILLKEKYESRK